MIDVMKQSQPVSHSSDLIVLVPNLSFITLTGGAIVDQCSLSMNLLDLWK
jgi:hypothetical protein